jgi:hypothetical protein
MSRTEPMRAGPAVDPSSARALARPEVGFIVGAARSGTTLLYKALCLHPDVAFISNWVARFPGMPGLARLDRVARIFPSAARRVWFADGSNAYVYGARRPLWRRAFPQPVEGEPVYRAAGVPAVPDEGALVGAERALRETLGAVRRHSAGSLLISKRIANNLRIPFLARAFPEARFIEIVRDGRAVAYSLSRVDWWPSSRVWWYGGTPQRWREEGRDPWEICARNWVEEVRAIRHALRDVPSQQRLQLRYEHLIERPIEVLGRAAAFLGLEPNARWQRSVRALEYPDRTDEWRNALDEATVTVITRVQADELERHGYAV